MKNSKTNQTDSKEFGEKIRILQTGVKEKKISFEEMDAALFTGDPEELRSILNKAKSVPRRKQNDVSISDTE